MKRRRINSFLIGEGVACIVLFILIKDQAIGYDSIISFPFVHMGNLLRKLSMSGSSGNIIAWIAYVLLCAWPLLLLGLRIRKRSQNLADMLLVVLSALLFVSMYFMINPGLAMGVLMPAGLGDAWKIGISSVIYMVVLAYVVLRLILRFQTGKTERLLADLAFMLIVFAVLLVMALTFAMPFEIMREMESIEAANTMTGIDFSLTHLFVVLRKIIIMIPLLYQILIVLAGFDLVQELKIERYSTEVVEKAIHVGNRCKEAIVATVLASVLINITQLIVGAKLLHSNYHLEIPLLSILTVIITMLLAKYFAHSVEIKKEMDLFV